jgi:hypothetical protein
VGRKRALAGRESELLALYQSGIDMPTIAKTLGVSASTVAVELDRLGARKMIRRDDVLRGFEQMKQHPDFFFVLGMIWGVGSLIGDKFVIRHKNRQIIDRIYGVLKYACVSEPYLVRERPTIQIGITHPFFRFLSESGWVGRKSSGREMPKCDLDMEAFVSGYIRVHHSLTWSKNRVRKTPYLRLRIFGPPAIIEQISAYLSEWTGVGKKNLHQHSMSDKMVTVEYSIREEVDDLCNFLGLRIPEKDDYHAK